IEAPPTGYKYAEKWLERLATGTPITKSSFKLKAKEEATFKNIAKELKKQCKTLSELKELQRNLRMAAIRNKENISHMKKREKELYKQYQNEMKYLKEKDNPPKNWVLDVVALIVIGQHYFCKD
ncbi:hypothetical protein, partial [Escherichia coli]|uniref:hypothetical protein n=1 Tax=Escherichia coli TaxID=562 RepID=UPI003B993C52